MCNSYADHGHCIAGQSCPKSHNIDRIVLQKGGGVKRPPKSSVPMTDEQVQATADMLKEGKMECYATQ